MNILYFSLALFSLRTSASKCYYSDCGCPPFNNQWCSESSFSSGWCSQSSANCASCSGVHSDSCGAPPSTTTLPPTSEPTLNPTQPTLDPTLSPTQPTLDPTSQPTTSGDAVPALAAMVNFFEGTHGRDATYYTGHSGGCLMWDSDLAKQMPIVAVSSADFYQGLSCGTCVRVTSMTQRNGGDVLETPFTAMIGDLCAGCQQGDLDFAISGKDGRHDLTWEPIPCPVSQAPIHLRLTETNHDWYVKVQIRHARHPVQSVAVVGKNGDWVNLRNAGAFGGLGFFDSNIPNVDTFIQRPFEYPLSVRVCDIYGQCILDRIEELKNDVDQLGLHQFPVLSGSS